MKIGDIVRLKHPVGDVGDNENGPKDNNGST